MWNELGILRIWTGMYQHRGQLLLSMSSWISTWQWNKQLYRYVLYINNIIWMHYEFPDRYILYNAYLDYHLFSTLWRHDICDVILRWWIRFRKVNISVTNVFSWYESWTFIYKQQKIEYENIFTTITAQYWMGKAL